MRPTLRSAFARPIFASYSLALLLCAPFAAAQAVAIEEATGRLLPAVETAAVPPASIAVPPAEAIAAPPPVGAVPAVALLDFESASVSEEDIKALSEALWSQLNASRGVRMIPRDATRSWLIASDNHPFMPYGPRLALSSVAQKLQVQYLVTGRVEQVGEAYALEVNVHAADRELPILNRTGTRVASLQQMLLMMDSVAGDVRGAIGGGRASAGWAQSPVQAVRTGGANAPAKTAERAKTKLAAAAKPLAEPVAHAEPVAVAHAEPAPVVVVAPEPVVAHVTPEPAVVHATPSPVATATLVATPAPTPAVDEAAVLFREAMALPEKEPGRVAKMEQAVKLAPGSAQYTQQLAFDYFKAARYADCARVCGEALKLAPNDSKLLMIKGSAHISLSQWAEAVEACKASVMADATNNYSRFNLALALESMGSPEAKAAWQDFVDKGGHDADAQIQGLVPEGKSRLEKLEKK